MQCVSTHTVFVHTMYYIHTHTQVGHINELGIYFFKSVLHDQQKTALLQDLDVKYVFKHFFLEPLSECVCV